MQILFLSQWFPYPPSNGSKLRILNLLRALSRFDEITFVSFVDDPGAVSGASELHSLCREVVVVPHLGFNPSSFKAKLGFLSPIPRSVVDTYSPEMARCIEQLLASRKFDLVIASQIGTAIYGDSLRGKPALFEEVEVGVLYEQFARASSPQNRFRYGLTWTKHRRYLARLLRGYSCCTVVSEREKDLLRQAVPGYEAVEVIPNFVHLADYESVEKSPQPHTLVFTGSFRYPPNHAAMVWFLDKVFPRILAEYPDARLTITGDHMGRLVPSNPNVILTGSVSDVRPLIAGAWVSLAPIFTGGGTRLKILESMALRTPIVSTAKGAEGLDIQHGQHLLLADTPESFAKAVIDVLKDPELSRRLANNAYELVRNKYDSAKVMPQFFDLTKRIAGSPQ